MAIDQRELTLSSAQVCESAECSYRVLDYWIRIGVIEAVDAGPGRSGWVRSFTTNEAAAVRAVRTLSDLGIFPSSTLTKRVVDHVRFFGLAGKVRSGPFTFDLGCV